MVRNVSGEELRLIDFQARALMEAEVRKIDLKIIRAYRDTQLSIADDLQSFNATFPRGSNFETASTQVRLRSLQRSIAGEISALADTVDGLTRDAMAIGVDKAQIVSAESGVLLEVNGVAWGTYLNTSVRPYLESGLLLEKYPRSLKTYNDLLTHFNRDNYQYFKDLGNRPGFVTRYSKSRFNVGDISRLTDTAWAPIGELRQIFSDASLERVSYSQLVTTLRQDLWNLPPGTRNPRVTYEATRLARTEMIRTAALAQNSWGWETPGIVGVRRWFGGGACDGSCLQYVGYWEFARHGHPAAIPIHPHCGCYETFETQRRSEQNDQEVMLLSDGRYMDSMTYRHDAALAARVDGDDFPSIVQRYELQGSNRYYRPLRGDALRSNIRSRLEEIN